MENDALVTVKDGQVVVPYEELFDCILPIHFDNNHRREGNLYKLVAAGHAAVTRDVCGAFCKDCPVCVQNTRTTGQKRPRDEQGGMELARDIAEIFCAAAVDPRSTALPVAKLQFIEKHVSALVRDGRYQATASDSTDTYTLPDAVRGAKADEAVKILDGLQKLVGSFRGSFPSLPPPSPPSPE